MRHLAIAPGAFYDFIALGAKPFEMAIFPNRRQCGKQFYFAVMALQQHLGDAGCASKVAVDLERRMGA